MNKELLTCVSLAKPLRIRLKDPIGSFQNKLNLCFDISYPFIKLQVIKHQLPEELYSTTFVKENTINFLK
ncbi:unnamed protein product, partial [marine sediment metagenome]